MGKQRAPVIALASTKGGVGKTTVAVCLAAEFARSRASGLPELRVSCIDADPNRTLLQAVGLAGMPDIRCFEAEGGTLLQVLREAQTGADLVVIDLEGSANQAMLYAAGKADLVIIPAQPSRFDVVEALKTAGVVRQAADLVGREIEHRVLLTRTPVLRQRVADHSRSQFEKAGLPLLRTELVQRAAFQRMTYTGEPPAVQEPGGGAARNVEALTAEVAGLLVLQGGTGKGRVPGERRTAPGHDRDVTSVTGVTA